MAGAEDRGDDGTAEAAEEFADVAGTDAEGSAASSSEDAGEAEDVPPSEEAGRCAGFSLKRPECEGEKFREPETSGNTPPEVFEDGVPPPEDDGDETDPCFCCTAAEAGEEGRPAAETSLFAPEAPCPAPGAVVRSSFESAAAGAEEAFCRLSARR